tara:strand:- start:1 stop:102 length:102 start_codon:yes stop_codon:yes gene_type:complete
MRNLSGSKTEGDAADKDLLIVCFGENYGCYSGK